METRIDIAALRQRLGLSRKDLAKRLGMRAVSTICRWENGDSEPRGAALILLRQLAAESNNDARAA